MSTWKPLERGDYERVTRKLTRLLYRNLDCLEGLYGVKCLGEGLATVLLTEVVYLDSKSPLLAKVVAPEYLYVTLLPKYPVKFSDVPSAVTVVSVVSGIMGDETLYLYPTIDGPRVRGWGIRGETYVTKLAPDASVFNCVESLLDYALEISPT